MLVSIIIPTLQEEGSIGRCVGALSGQEGEWEVLVVDGGSRDRTRQRAEAAGARVLHAPPGRGTQLRMGAEAARGAALLFLHADVLLPPRALALVRETLSDPRWVGGAFPVRHDLEPVGALTRFLLVFASWHSRLRRHPYGDQCVFTSRDMYKRIGGFPPQPLMEDIEFSRRLRKAGRIRMCPAWARASGRRFARRPWRTLLAWNLFPLLYALGVPAARLARWYDPAGEALSAPGDEP